MKKETCLVKTWEIPKNWKPRMSSFELPGKGVIPPTIKKTGISRILNRKVLDVCGYLGSYGMGGPGFFGIKLEKAKKHPEEWLVLRFWGAADWLHFNGRIISCHPEQKKDFKPFEVENVRIILLANTIKSAVVKAKSCIFKFGNGHVLALKYNPKTRPVFAGSGEPRALKKGDDLNCAWILTHNHLAV